MKKGAELAGRDDVWELESYYIGQAVTGCVRRNQCAECVDVWISRTTGCCIVVRRAGVFDGVKIHKDCIPGLSKRHK